MQSFPSPAEEAKFVHFYEAECKRKEKLLEEFEKLERKQRRQKYERVIKGFFVVAKKNGDFIHLKNEKGHEVGVLQVNSEISKLLKVNDGLEGTFGFRNRYWRVHFLFCIGSSTDDFMPKEQ